MDSMYFQLKYFPMLGRSLGMRNVRKIFWINWNHARIRGLVQLPGEGREETRPGGGWGGEIGFRREVRVRRLKT